MISFLDKLIARLFYLLLFLTPLIFWPFSSELFEFNKIVFVYFLTVLILTAWILKCVLAKKLIFRRTLLDIPIVIFLFSLGISTFFSIDVRTSLLGYYSRFHGGLISYLAYSLLYWAYVSNLDRDKSKRAIFFLVAASFPVILYGILQHFGIDKDIWVQDVQNRIFSTLGQPNWLAAWLVAVMPLGWAFYLKKNQKTKGRLSWLWIGIPLLSFACLLFTKSRSGLLGFALADLIFWSSIFWHARSKALFAFIVHHMIFFALILVIGTPFTKSIPAPETGGTESGEIRKIVWEGAVDLWKKYPLLGTGPETFAYSYYETRPAEHNLVSEWNFLYNKAHNEYLNFAATTGSVGLGAYLLLVLTMFLQIISGRKKRGRLEKLSGALLAGFVSILLTNFFGFSVVPIALLFFMLPALAITLEVENPSIYTENKGLSHGQKVACFFVLGIMFWTLYRIGVYWYADSLYAKGKLNIAAERFPEARGFLVRTAQAFPKEAVFWDELARSSAALAVILDEKGEKEKGAEFASLALSESEKAISLSPRNINLQRSRVFILERLVAIEPNNLLAKKVAFEELMLLAPTDASLYYALALTEARIGQSGAALKNLDLAIGLKANYKNARFTKALILISLGRTNEAREELSYILEKIDPDDNLVRQELERLDKK